MKQTLNHIGIVPMGRLSNAHVNILNDRNEQNIKCLSQFDFLDISHTHFLLVDACDTEDSEVAVKFRLDFEKYLFTEKKLRTMVATIAMGGQEDTLQLLAGSLEAKIPALVIKQSNSKSGANFLASALDKLPGKIKDPTDSKDKEIESLKKEVEKFYKSENKTSGKKKQNGSRRDQRPNKDGNEKPTPEEEATLIEKALSCLEAVVLDQTKVAIITGSKSIDDELLSLLVKSSSKESDRIITILLYVLWDRGDEFERKQVYAEFYPDPRADDLESVCFMALALNRVDFLKSFDAALINEVFRDLKEVDLKFLYWYRAYCIDVKTKEMTGMLRHFINEDYEDAKKENEKDNEKDKLPLLPDKEVLLKYYETTGCIDLFTDLIDLPMRGISLKTIERIMDKLCSDMSKGLKEFSRHEKHAQDEISTGLFMWAVLNGMCDMALFLIGLDNQECAKALIAAEMTLKMSENDDLTERAKKKYKKNSSEYQKLSVGIIEEGYEVDSEKTVEIITRELEVWKEFACVDLAVGSKQLDFVSHPSVQSLLNQLWAGPLKHEINLTDFFMTVVCPPYLLSFDFRNDKSLEKLSSQMDERIIPLSEWCLKSLLCSSNKDDKDKDKSKNARKATIRKVTIRKNSHRPSQSDNKDLDSNIVKADEKENNPNTMENKSFFKMFTHRIYLYYFKTPVVKFYFHLLSYIIFLALLSFTVLQDRDYHAIGIVEWIVLAIVISLTTEEIRQLAGTSAFSVLDKVRYYISSFWNMVDLLANILFYVGFALRAYRSTHEIGHLVLAFDAYIWILRLLPIFYNFEVTGPYVFMIQSMFKDMMKFLSILFVFTMAHGVCFTAIMAPQKRSWNMLRDVIFHPYYNIYGELFFEDPKANTNNFGTDIHNDYDNTIGLVLLAIYVLIANVLLLNLLIAVFGSTYADVSLQSKQIWGFQRYELIIEYATRSVLVPPFIVFSHIWSLCAWVYRSCCQGNKSENKKNNVSRFKRLLKSARSREIDTFESEMTSICIQENSKPKVLAPIKKNQPSVANEK